MLIYKSFVSHPLFGFQSAIAWQADWQHECSFDPSGEFMFRAATLYSSLAHVRLPTERRGNKISYSSLAQSVERMTVNHDVVGSSPTGGAKKSRPIGLNFFICVRRTQHHLTEGQHHFERSENIIIHSRHKWTRLHFVQMMYFVMMLRLWRKRCCASRKRSGCRSFGMLIDSWFLAENMI